MQLPRPRGKKIGLLGGSFNPAHAGHLHISRLALKRLKLDEVWWLVSPQNPLKEKKGMASLEHRLTSAERVCRVSSRITPTTLEATLKTQYTIDTLRALKRAYPQVQFVWLMGADNLAQMEKWKHWKEIFREVPIAVFDRAPYSKRAIASRAASFFSGAKRPDGSAALLARLKPPAWMFLNIPRHPISSTALRNATKGV